MCMIVRLLSALAPCLLQEDGLKVAERLVRDGVGQRERAPRVDLGGGHVDDAARLRQGLAAGSRVDLVEVVRAGVRDCQPAELGSRRDARGAAWRVELDHGEPSGGAAHLQRVVNLSLCLQVSHRALASLRRDEICSSPWRGGRHTRRPRNGRHAQSRRFQGLRYFLLHRRKLLRALSDTRLLIPEGQCRGGGCIASTIRSWR
mmetsp:Transcript_15895/g.39344  ORF Transcript_15895/g.39344 Transcript_15895/m.39344 type:complete len:203 (+) Transcript_15895:172-780(+)